MSLRKTRRSKKCPEMARIKEETEVAEAIATATTEAIRVVVVVEIEIEVTRTTKITRILKA